MLRKHRSLGHDKEMLRNLDILAYEQYTLQQLKQLPPVQKVMIEVEDTYPRNSSHQYPLCCQISEFKQYGPGVYLVFRFIKYTLIVMGILIPLPTINLIVLALSQDHFVGKNISTTLQITTISNMKDSNSSLVIALNFVVLVVFTICILYWKYIQTDEVLSCTKKTSLSSYYTVILSTIPNYYSEHDLVQHLQQYYGKVHSIYTVKNYEKDLIKYRQMEHIIEKFREERELFLRKKAKDSCLKLVQLFFAYKQKHQVLLEKILDHANYEPALAFVTFQTVSSRNKLLSDLQVKFNCCGNKTSIQDKLENQKFYKGQRLQFKSCQMQPNGIIWQNINVPIKEKLLRICLIFCLLAVFLLFSITVFFVLAAAHSSLYSDQFQHYTQEEILQMNNTYATKSYCLDLSYSLFRSKSFCSPYLKDYVNYFILYLAIPLFVTFLKGFFVLLMKKLVVIRRHKYQFYKIKWEIAIITLFYFIKAGLIKWVIYRSFTIGNFHFQLIDIFMPLLKLMTHVFPIRPDLIPKYEDFNQQWVAHASHSTILIAILSFNFSIVLFYFTSIIVKKYKQKAAESQETHKKMKQMLKGQQFQFQFIYSQFLALFLFCMLYFSCSPIIYLLVYISILLLYWVSKHNLLKLSQIPPVYAHTIHEMAVRVIMIGLMMNSLVSPLYYANLDESNHSSWPQRWLTYWYYTLNFIVLLLSFTCDSLIVKIYFFFKNKIVNFIQNTQLQIIREKRINSMASISSSLQSYSMHSSQKYKQVLKTLFALNRNQVQHLGVFTQKDIQEIKSSIGKSQNQFKIFQELQYFLAQYIKKAEKDPQKPEQVANKQKVESYKRQLQKIRQQVDKEIKEQQKLVQLHSMVNSKLVHLKKSKIQMSKFQEAERKASKQNSAHYSENIVDQMEQCMNTDIRIA